MFAIKLNRASSSPLYQQIFQVIVDNIRSGKLVVGDTLPPSRLLADQLKVSRTTICKAYDELYALGLIESHQGSYSKIRKSKVIGKQEKPKSARFNWQQKFTNKSQQVTNTLLDVYNEATTASSVIDFTTMAPDPNLMPVDDFRKCLNKSLKIHGTKLLQYGSKLGYLPLRKYLVNHLKQYGVNVQPEEILLTSGSQQSLDLICQMLINPGDSVFTESPSYSLIYPMLSNYQANIIETKVEHDGLSLKELATKFKTDNGKFIYTIPNFHNPTGISTSQLHREAFYQLCLQNDCPIVEDGFVDELKYFGKTPLPIKAQDDHGLVIYLGSFSKILFPGIRIGWIVANKDCIEQLSHLKLLGNLRGNQLNQAAMALFCQHGYYDKHIKRAHAIYRRRMTLTQQYIKQKFPHDTFTATMPNGGYALFVSATSKCVSEEKLISDLYQAGVIVTPGKNFYQKSSPFAEFRLSIAELEVDEIKQGINRIANVLHRYSN